MITLGVRDLDAAIRFYRDGLGFPKMDSSPEVALFTLNGTWLGSYGLDSLAEYANVPSVRTGFPGFSLAHNVETEEEVDAFLTYAANCGAEITKPAVRENKGVRTQ